MDSPRSVCPHLPQPFLGGAFCRRMPGSCGCGGLSYMPSPGIKWMSQSADGDFEQIRRNFITENVSSNFGPYHRN